MQFRRATPADLKALGVQIIDTQREKDGYVIVDGWVHFIYLTFFGKYKLYHLVPINSGTRKKDDFLIPTDPSIVADYQLYESIREKILSQYAQSVTITHGDRIREAFIKEKQRQERVAKINGL